MAIIAAGAIAAGAYLGGGLMGANAKKKKAEAKKKLWKQSLGIYGDFMNDPNSYLKQGADQYNSAIGTLQKGFKDAKMNLGMAGGMARQTTRTQGAQATAGAKQSMISRGLYGTTAFDNAQRGISSDVSRQLAAIDENVGSMMAGLQTQSAMATAGAQQAYGGYLGQAYGAKQNTMENYINLLRDKPMNFSRTEFAGQQIQGSAQMFASLMGTAYGKGGG